jgi:hypothetical protein
MKSLDGGLDLAQQQEEYFMNKKVWLIALIAVIGLTTVAFAQTEADFKVELTKDNEGVVITAYTGRAAVVRIPATIQGMPVREIGAPDWGNGKGFYQNNIVTSVVIPQGVTKIGPYAFYQASKLTSVTLPEGLTEIGENAFNYASITSISLPKSLTTIGDSAFSYTNITAVTLPAALTKIGYDAFDGCGKLRTVTISEGITVLPDANYIRNSSRYNGLFTRCTALTTVTLPSTLTKIGVAAFQGCTALTTINLPDSITTIGDSAFSGCTALTAVTLPPSIRTIETSAFNGCTALARVTFPPTITDINARAFWGCAFTTITLPGSVKMIGDRAFSDCKALTTVTVPEIVLDITFVGNAFAGCSKLNLASQAALKKVGYTGNF